MNNTQNKNSTQLPNVAGLFYPAEPTNLRDLLADCFAEVKLPTIDTMPKALVVPHAGYTYSGITAAHAFAALKKFSSQIKRVVVAAPAHHIAFTGVAFPEVDYFLTPLGEIPVNQKSLERIADLPETQKSNQAFAGEHALEVELPFLQTVLADFELIPLMIGQTNPEKVANVLDKLWDDKETIFVISADLSHYLPYEAAQKIDEITAKAIENLDAETITHQHACGYIGIRAVIQIAKQRGLKATTLDLRNSGDTGGDKQRVVGYGAFMFTE